MSLRAVFDKEKTQSIKNVLPDEIIVYKIALLIQKEDRLLTTSYPAYISPVCATEYSGGEQTISWKSDYFMTPLVDKSDESLSYYPGFHSFAQKTPIIKFLQEHADVKFLLKFPIETSVILTCGVLKDWITAIGIEGERDMVIVSNRIVIPTYPHTDIRNDKNCEWFFEAQSKAKIVSPDLINAKSKVITEEIPMTYKQYKKYKELGREY